MKQRKKIIPKSHTRPLGVIFLCVGMLLLSYYLIHTALYNRSLSLSTRLLQAFSAKKNSLSALPLHISIGETIRLPVIEAGVVDGKWLIAEDKANHVWNSANPTDKGNIIIYAHNTPPLFGTLENVAIGEYVHVVTSDGVDHQYQIISKEVVSPAYTTPLQPTSAETLTIYTCTGFLDSQRLVIRAIPNSP